MKQFETHLTDEDLRSVVAEQPTSLPLEQIETHIETCEECQTRMLNLAGEQQWRQDVSSSLAELREMTAGEVDTRSVVTDGNGPTGDAFDLQTVDDLLREVLGPPSHPETLGTLGRYEIESLIGCGGMGVVLRGFDRDLHRPVAIKMILPRLAKNGTAKQRFAREARAAAAVLHPNVIGIHGIESAQGVPWFVMPLIAGPTLQSLVEEHGPLPEREIVRIGLQLAGGLAAAHSQGLVHRDIKPANVLVDNEVNRVVLTDFGLARSDAEQSMTQTGWLAGTVNYMSPEQSRGEDVDARSDLFSLGSLLYFLATGAVPFSGPSAFSVLQEIASGKPKDVRSLNSEISSTLAAVIAKLLQKNPQQRFQSATELEEFFEELIAYLNRPTQYARPKLPTSSQIPRAVAICSLPLLMISAAFGATYYGDWFPKKSPEVQRNEIEKIGSGIEEDGFLNPTYINRLAEEAKQFGEQLGEASQEVAAVSSRIEQAEDNSPEFWEGSMLEELNELERKVILTKEQLEKW